MNNINNNQRLKMNSNKWSNNNNINGGVLSNSGDNVWNDELRDIKNYLESINK